MVYVTDYSRSMSTTIRHEPSEAAKCVAASREAHDVTLAGSGTEFLFYTAVRDGHLEGYRIPRTPEFKTPNNPGVSALGLQRQEMALATWASENGIPSAQPVDLIEQDGFPVLIVSVVDDDGSELDAAALGGAIASMHRLQPPRIDFVAQDNTPVAARIAQRVAHRHAELSKNVQLPTLPTPERMLRDLEAHMGPPRPTHLDIRRQNVRVQEGRPLSLFDWSNALPAAPELEIARIEEYAAIAANGLGYKAFREGYAAAGGVVNETSAAWPLFRLDAAVMLAVVFSSVAPDEALRTLFVGRIRGLLKEL